MFNHIDSKFRTLKQLDARTPFPVVTKKLLDVGFSNQFTPTPNLAKSKPTLLVEEDDSTFD